MEKLLAEISGKLDKLIALKSIEGKSEDQQIRILQGYGFDWETVGKMLGVTANAAKKRFYRTRGDGPIT